MTAGSSGASRSGTARVGGAGDAFASEWCMEDPVGDTGCELDADGRGRAAEWVEHLDTGQCWELLASVGVGRLGVLVDSAPEVYPVNFVVDRRSLVFRTDPGTKLRGLDRSPTVCFEVDCLDEATQTGWSVLVKGRAAEVHGVHERRELERLGFRLWAVGAKAHWIRIEASEVTGRRIHRSSPPRPEGR